jgi:hypothetical protein
VVNAERLAELFADAIERDAAGRRLIITAACREDRRWRRSSCVSLPPPVAARSSTDHSRAPRSISERNEAIDDCLHICSPHRGRR